MVKKTVTLLTALSLTSCTIINPSLEIIETGFAQYAYSPTEKQLQELSRSRLEFERKGKNRGNLSAISTRLTPLLEEVPLAAQFLIDQDIACCDGNLVRNLRAKALKTLIRNRQFEYLNQYWDGVYNQLAPYWFDVKFALEASTWVAKNLENSREGAAAQERLAIYHIDGCSTSILADRSNQITRFDYLLGNCVQHPDQAVRWFGQYLKNTTDSKSNKLDLAYKIANIYFDRAEYGLASGWYLAAVEISNQDDEKFLEQDFFGNFRALFWAGQPLETASSEAFRKAKRSYDRRVDKCQKRLNLIREAGIKVVPLYGLSL